MTNTSIHDKFLYINQNLPVLKGVVQQQIILELIDEMKSEVKSEVNDLSFNMSQLFMRTIIAMYTAMYNDDVGKVCLYRPIFEALRPYFNKESAYRFSYVPIVVRTNTHIIDRPQYIEILFDIISTGVTIPEEDIDILPRLVRDFIRL